MNWVNKQKEKKRIVNEKEFRAIEANTQKELGFLPCSGGVMVQLPYSLR